MADKDIASKSQDPDVVPGGEGESVYDEPLEASSAEEGEANLEPSVDKDKRKRRLTEKGQELHDETLKKLQRNFNRTYVRWKVLAKEARKALSLPHTDIVLQEHQNEIHSANAEVKQRYEDVRRHSTPDGDTRRRVDTCEAVSRQLCERLSVLLHEDTAQHLLKIQAPWGNTGSVFSCEEDKVSVRSSLNSGRISGRSSLSSIRKLEAQAELAATKATLKVLDEMEQEEKELQRLEDENRKKLAQQEAENRRKLAQQEAENAERRKLLEEKRRQLERLEATKRMSAAKARLQVYEQDAGSDEEISDLLHDHNLLISSPKRTVSRYSMPLQSGNKRFTTSHEVPRPTFQDNSTNLLAEAIAESINASRLPVPEPPVFSGDPIRYEDWKMSFQTLIGRKNIPVNEKIYYLRKYVAGAAKKAIEGYFLVGTEKAYESAWEILEERYGNSFVVAKAFRDKLILWPKIGPKDSVELREFADFLRGCQAAMCHIKNLAVLNDCSENQKLLSKLPDWLTARWNRKVVEFEEATKTFPSFSDFVEFVAGEAKIACNPMTSLHALKSGDVERAKPSKVRNVGAKVLASASEEKPDIEGQKGDAKDCMFCEKGNHGIQTCRKFMEKPVKERIKYVQTKKLCFACLKPGHQSKTCEKRSFCNTCKGRHPTCLHEDRTKADESVQVDRQKESGKQTKERERSKEPKHNDTRSTTSEVTSTATSNQVMHNGNSTYASTIVPVWLSTTSNPEAEVLVYALLDSQSDSTFILRERAETLDTQMEPVQLKLSTLASKQTVIPSHKIFGLQVRGFYSSKKIRLPVTYSREFIPASLSHIPTPKTARAWTHLEHLADEIAPLIDCDVGLLIGYNCSQALLPREIVSGKDDEPFAVKTDLGWSIVGCVSPCIDYGDAIGSSHRIVVRQVTPTPQSPCDLTSQVQYICRTQVKEIIVPTDVLKVLESDFSERNVEDAHFSQDDLRFISIMEEGIKTHANGQREMPLPFKENKPCLPNNLKCADHRLRCLKRRFQKDKQYHKDYVAFMNDIISCGDAEKVPESEVQHDSCWYIPHHGVYHHQKVGKIRVVFDCSAKFEGISLNDHLLTGPELTNTLVGVLCRFRKGPVAVMCDIERMFHQFRVRAEHQDYLRFLWWNNGDIESEPSVYRMKVHLFGAASSPGCANYGLKHVAAQGRGRFSEATIHFIERNFYVDDGLISVSTAEEAIQLVSEARQLCSSGRLRIHKFVSNCQEVLASIPEEECADVSRSQDLALGEPQMERALGVKWCVTSDHFSFRVVVDERPLSRRGVLSTVASIFDPLGFVAPFILIGKQILQQMCHDKVGWDEPLPDDLRPRWESWLFDLKNLADVKIKRCYLPSEFKEVQRYELHYFADASVTGYGACTYMRAISDTGQIHCSLVAGKARVAPTKVTTVPRLELSAAVVAARMSDMLRKELEIDAQEVFWTDSKVVLGYVNNDARRFHVFVANRIQRIKDSTRPDQWRHVSSEDNPADHASRGLRAKELIASNWFSGPDFLWREELPCGNVEVEDIAAEDPEVRNVSVHKSSATEVPLLDRFCRFSCWTRLVKAIARLKRLAKELKGSIPRTNEATSLLERSDAEVTIINLVQREAFAEEIQSLQHGKELAKSSKLHKLNPFFDEQGILRVGGRLRNADLHHHIKHPAVLPAKGHVTTLLIQHYHNQVQHQGRGITLNELRANGFWILGCSHAVSSFIYKCVKCRKFRRSAEQQQMADLPRDRMEETPPFSYCGMDCFGPFYVKDGRKESKRYGLLFTCLCSRAVHIELLEEMTTDFFIIALRAFIAIRGNVRQLRCDQGTNFVGARREFAEALKEMDQECLKSLGCEFVMNPPSASHMGGAWERQIRTIRSVLTSILDQSSRRLDSASLRTYFYEVMAVINSRPLTAHLLNDPMGPQPLSPNHILTMKSSIILPPPGRFEREDLYLRKRWRKVQFLANEFWSRWRKEYLLNLQQRCKWQRKRRNAEVNDIVIVQDDTVPRTEWKLAKVTKVYPAEDGCVRKLQLLISDSTLDKHGKRIGKPVYLERPIHKTVTLIEAE